MVVVRVRAKNIAGNVVEEDWTDFDGGFRIEFCRNHVNGDSVVLEAAFPTYRIEEHVIPARSAKDIRIALLRTDTTTVLGLDSVKVFRGEQFSLPGCATDQDPDPLYVHCDGTVKSFSELKGTLEVVWKEWRLYVP